MNLIKKAYCLLLVLLYSTILQAQDSRWNVNIYDYQYDMSVYAELQYNGSVITDFSNICPKFSIVALSPRKPVKKA